MLTCENGFVLTWRRKFPEARKYSFTFIALFIALFLVYANSFRGDWLFDDFFNIVENPNIQMKSFSPEEIKRSLFALSTEKPTRPLAYFSFALNYYFGGLDVFGYHLINFIIHYLAAIFLFLFIYNTLKLPRIKDDYKFIAYPVALLATFFWALHPIHVTSVTYIVQRMASMAGMFYILSMYFYLKARTSEKTGISIAFFAACAASGLAAVFSKENAALLPACLLLYDLFLIRGVSKEALKKYLKISLLPFAAILIIALIHVDFSTIFKHYDLRDFTPLERMLSQPRVFIFYLSLLFYPIYSRLTLLYDIEVSRALWQPWTTMPAIILVILIVALALCICRKRPLISFCIIFYFLNHLIEGSFFNLELIYEHRNYLPSMLLFIPASLLIISAIDYFSYKRSLQFLMAAGIAIIVFGLGEISHRRNAILSNEFLLWADNIEKYPNLSRPYTNLGNAYMAHNQEDEGLKYYKKAMKLDNFANTHVRALQEYNLGVYYYKKGKLDDAYGYFVSAHKVMPLYLPNSAYLAKIYLIKKETAAARRLVEPLLYKYPEIPALNELYGLILFKENNFPEAKIHAKKSLEKNLAGTLALPLLAEISRRNGDLRFAARLWNLYQQSFPVDAHANLALIELYSETDGEKLNDELAKLFCLKKTLSIATYLNDVAADRSIIVYYPNIEKIKSIVLKHDIIGR